MRPNQSRARHRQAQSGTQSKHASWKYPTLGELDTSHTVVRQSIDLRPRRLEIPGVRCWEDDRAHWQKTCELMPNAGTYLRAQRSSWQAAEQYQLRRRLLLMPVRR